MAEGERGESVLPRVGLGEVVAAVAATGIGWDSGSGVAAKKFRVTEWMVGWIRYLCSACSAKQRTVGSSCSCAGCAEGSTGGGWWYQRSWMRLEAARLDSTRLGQQSAE